jgi:hypothetical protein
MSPKVADLRILRHGTPTAETSIGSVGRTRLLALLIVGSIASFSSATPVQWSPGAGRNGHYYEVVPGPGTTFQRITWNDAKTAAESSSFLGVNGSLVTITSSAESQFVSTLLTDPGSGFAWLGGLQPSASPELDGNWQWTTGETWSFTNWDTGEPSNFYQGDVGGPPAGSPEDALHSRPGGKWNDLPHDAFLPGYLVEYAIPEPSTLLVLSTGAITLLGFRKKVLLVK